MEFVNLSEAEGSARERLPYPVYCYYAGGAHDEITLAENRRAYDHIALRPRVLVDVSRRDLSTTVLGERVALPVLVAPMAFLRMAPAALGRGRSPLDVSFEFEGRRERRAALLVLVANNDYRIESMADLGERARLDEGLLHAYVIEAVSRRALVALLARAAVRNVGEAEGLVEWTAERFSVESSRSRIHAAIDGEPVVLETPLAFEVKPRALRVLVPPSAAQGGVE